MGVLVVDPDGLPLALAVLAKESLVGLSVLALAFTELHLLITESGGSHPGIFLVRMDNDRRRDMAPHHIALAIQKVLHSGLAIANQLVTLNQWR